MATAQHGRGALWRSEDCPVFTAQRKRKCVNHLLLHLVSCVLFLVHVIYCFYRFHKRCFAKPKRAIKFLPLSPLKRLDSWFVIKHRFRLFKKMQIQRCSSLQTTAARSKRLSTLDDKAAADRKHLTCLVIRGYSSEPAISTGSGICQMPSNLPHGQQIFLTSIH